ncbi:esterase/lipase family protein [Lysobacter yangpyeongensis]|uniref:Esterase/lipase family protein n=1 Tax=Lysobacter yangpyeongensis TaxID=346182 RepID=A0ABW0SIL4_9GAMM
MSLVLLLALVCSSCAVVSVRQEDAHRAGDDSLPVRGDFSVDTGATLSAIGRTPEQCRAEPEDCAKALDEVASIAGDQVLASRAELYLVRGTDTRCGESDAGCEDRRAVDLIESARSAYLYLFFGDRTPEERVFERRQVEVRAFYNHALQELTKLLYARYRGRTTGPPVVMLGDGLRLDVQLPEGAAPKPPLELIPASGLSFSGLRNIYRRDGFGAEFVAVREPEAMSEGSFQQLDYQPVTLVLKFEGENAAQVRTTRVATLQVFDIYRNRQARLGGRDVSLAANFSAAYGLWLARTDLIRLGLSGLVGRGDLGHEVPRVVMLEPYDPNRRVLVLVHGLASSQEAWINVANEVMGDPMLRERLQIWQVVYPTRMPLLVSHARIDKALRTTFQHFDPAGTAQASHDAVLVGHSMGGVIARLLVTQPDPGLLDRLLAADLQLDAKRRAEIAQRPIVKELLQWSPLPQVGCVVFIATPHRGAPLAERRIGRFVGRLVRLPADVVRSFEEALRLSGASKEQFRRLGVNRPQNGVDELAQNSQFMLATQDMPVEEGLPFHSIIARSKSNVALELSSDGLVPFASAHLPGAASETVITSGHSVQEAPEAILELRRILHKHVGTAF